MRNLFILALAALLITAPYIIGTVLHLANNDTTETQVAAPTQIFAS